MLGPGDAQHQAPSVITPGLDREVPIGGIQTTNVRHRSLCALLLHSPTLAAESCAATTDWILYVSLMGLPFDCPNCHFTAGGAKDN